jgi:hypothetical protein
MKNKIKKFKTVSSYFFGIILLFSFGCRYVPISNERAIPKAQFEINSQYEASRQNILGLNDFTHCQFSRGYYQFHHPLLGPYNICVSRTGDSNHIALEVKNPILNQTLCFYPTGRNEDNKQIMLGSKVCLLLNNDSIYKLYLPINRIGYFGSIMEGIIIFPNTIFYDDKNTFNDSLQSQYYISYPNAYEKCMEEVKLNNSWHKCQILNEKNQHHSIIF